MNLLSAFFARFFLSLFIYSALMVSGAAAAENSETFKLDLSGTWHIRLGDDPSWAEGTSDIASSWDKITLPGNLLAYAHEKATISSGTAWLQKTVPIPPEWVGRDIGLCLGRISHADETFFNGEKLGGEGQFPPNEMGGWYIPRFYFISGDLLKPGAENVIRVRVWFHTYGDVAGDLYLADPKTWQSARSWDYFSRIIVNYVIIGMGGPLWLIFILFYFQRPESKEYLLYGVQLFCGVFIILDLCSLWPFPGGISAQYKTVAFSWIGLNVAHSIFLHRFYTMKRETIEKLLAACLFLSLPFFFVIKETDYRFYGMGVVILSGAAGIYNLSCHITALWQKKPYARIFSLFGLTAVFGAFHDLVIYTSKLLYFDITKWGHAFNYMFFPISAAALYTGTATVLVYQFMALLKSNEDLNENLEHKVSERTRSLILFTEELEKKNITLEDTAIRDSLTGLYNHAAFCDRLDEIFMTSKQNLSPMVVAMIDVDNFKGFNDTYGHPVGDEVLKKISDVLRASIREYNFSEKFQSHRMDDNRDYDLAGRYGGDEFMIVLPKCDQVSAMKVIGRICSKINQIRIDNHPDVQISGSFGVACFDPRHKCPSSDTLISLADSALYKSKSLGKNRIFCLVYEER